MEYTRYSSQPATIDLVRADLAETWAIDGFETESPRRSPSISRVSDMLDLEYISTPSSPTSKATKRDPLPDILGDFLELSPIRRKRRSASQERTGISSPKSSNSPGETQPQHPKTSKRKNPNQSTTAAELPVKSSGPKSRKTTTASDAKKEPAKASKQVKVIPTLPARTKAKKKTSGDDLFELSDVTDTESEPRPKKRQAKQPSPKGRQPPPQRKARIIEKRVSSPTTQNNKPRPGPKKPLSHDAPQKRKAKAGPAKTDTTPHADQEEAPDAPDCRDDEAVPTIAGSAPSEHLRKGDPAFDFKGRDSPNNAPSPEPQKHLPDSVGGSDLLPPTPLKHQDVISLSNESADAGAHRVVVGSNSPMFMERAEENTIAEDAPGTAIMINTGPSSEQQSPKQLSVDHGHLGSTPPPSFQLHAPGYNHQGIEHSLPARIQEAFFSDEQLAAPSSSPAPALPSNAEECSRPQDVWKQVVDDDSPPAILHRIVTLLHRSLKPREEVVRDISEDYKANALNLLNNLSARHGQEKKTILTALRKASNAAFAIFSGAGQDMATLISKLRDMDVTHTADTIRRPVLAEKLDSVVTLCQARLGPAGDDVLNESENGLDGLAETYRLKLTEAARQSDDQSPGTSGKVELRVDEFMRQCLDGKPKRIPSPAAKKPERPARNADEALEVLLDGIINTFQKSRDGGNLDRAVENIANVVSEDSDMADIASMDFIA
ncbi:hypothetical protein F5144DRAFT_481482 [Chaetomium tenue]|uniref:Uncharacterized protein n=1 Tax=Chaetomium tenue TaxID=1854479 RepID=A0ACB7PPV2_9PEZI|nr:hypothetical protein F5144DRAFT_481482 [Chaetomium globosum]